MTQSRDIPDRLLSLRPPQEGIPQTRELRSRVEEAARRVVARKRLAPPLSLPQLEANTEAVLAEAGLDASQRPYAAVSLNNALWREPLAKVPFERRLLLLPQCLRHPTLCAGQIDEFGLLCAACGRCVIQSLQAEAERLGYVVMVAEGSAVVMRLIETGQVEAIVGVSCLATLQRVFPYMEAAAVPGIALPLLYDGCRETTFDLDAIREVLYMASDEHGHRLPLEAIRTEVDGWFTPDGLAETLGPPRSRTEQTAHEALAVAGKRWRPFLTVCAAMAFADDPEGAIPPGLRRLAVAVECFHKASLIHDDIEDGDAVRYGHQTLHARMGVPFALNVGDFLLGEGYRLIAACSDEPALTAQMSAIAAEGHRTLALGQGAELAWAAERSVLTVDAVLEIFRRKTAPAFEVALRLGAVFGLGDDRLGPPLTRYCLALGAAYQIRDDLDDYLAHADGDDLAAGRLSILPALALPMAADEADRRRLEAWWRQPATTAGDVASVRRIVDRVGAPLAAMKRMETEKDAAVAALVGIDSTPLKALLRRVVGRIFCDYTWMECCDDDAPEDAGGGLAGPRAAD